MEKNIVCAFEDERKNEEIVVCDKDNISERIFEKMDWEIDSIMRELEGGK